MKSLQDIQLSRLYNRGTRIRRVYQRSGVSPSPFLRDIYRKQYKIVKCRNWNSSESLSEPPIADRGTLSHLLLFCLKNPIIFCIFNFYDNTLSLNKNRDMILRFCTLLKTKRVFYRQPAYVILSARQGIWFFEIEGKQD